MLLPRAILLAALVLGACRAPAESPPPGFERAGSLVLERLDGGSVAPLDAPGAAAVLLVFVAPDCPIANVYAPEIERIRAAYGPRRVESYLVYSDPSYAPEAIRRHLADFRLSPPALIDFEGRLAGLVGATVTPEAAVWVPGRGLRYRGRIDDLYTDFGKKRAEAGERDLRRALDRVLAGDDRGGLVTTRAIGCFLPARADRR